MDRYTVETALDSGRLFIKMRNGNSWRVRRNGKTQTWKRDPNRFRIPMKAGLRMTFQFIECELLNFDTCFEIRD